MSPNVSDLRSFARARSPSDIIWLPYIIDKLATKHQVTPEEVDEVLFSRPLYRKIQKGHNPGEDVYSALG
jgi:hypothetical protein